MAKEEYNDEPVLYCQNCLNLTIKTLRNTTIDYCTNCGDTNIGSAHIIQWEAMYSALYDESYVKGDKKLEK